MRNIVVLGATSAIAKETAKIYAKNGDLLFLVGRNKEKLSAVHNELKSFGAARVESFCIDMTQASAPNHVFNQMQKVFARVDVCLVAYGDCADQALAEREIDQLKMILEVNFSSAAVFLTLMANQMALQGSGSISVIGSVAGDRGKRKNYVYGSAKAGLEVFVQGLRSRLHARGVHVLLIKPGFVDTPMTAHMKKNILFADPSSVGRAIYRATESKKDILYVPGYWRFIMLILKLIPEYFYKKLPI